MLYHFVYILYRIYMMKISFKRNKIFVLSFLFATLLVGGLASNNFNNKLIETHADTNSYWSSIKQSSIDSGGETLMDALKTKISVGAKQLSYNELWTAYEKTDLVPGTTTKIWDMYGGFQFTYKTDQAGSYSSEGDVYNREHSIPKSWFNEKTPMYSDLVHLVPTDGKVNGMRSNYAFGEVNVSTYSHSFPERKDGYGNVIQNSGVSRLGSPKSINGCSTNETIVFEPDDQYKGDFARIYYYFATRYQGVAASGSGSAIFSNNYPYLTAYGKALLKKWHEQDPVSQKEIDRNNGIESCQNNRNPYVDHPEWANSIFGTNYNVEEADPTKVTITDSTIAMKVGDYHYFTSYVSPANASQSVSWTSSDENIITISEGGNAYAVSEGTATLTVKSKVNASLSDSITVTVGASGGEDPVIPQGSGTIKIDGSTEGFNGDDKEHTLNVSGYSFNCLGKKYSNNYVWFTENKGYLYNSTSLGKITKITINYAKGGSPSAIQKLSFGNSKIEGFKSTPTNGTTISTSTPNTSQSYSPTGDYGFFNLSVSNKNLQAASIEIEYENNDTPITPEPVDKYIVDISIYDSPEKLNYVEGEKISPEGLVISVNYSDGTSEEISYLGNETKFEFDPSLDTALSIGDDVITIKYQSNYCYLDINITEYVKPDDVPESTITFKEDTSLSLFNIYVDSVDSSEKVTGSFDIGEGNNPSKYYSNGDAVRCYPGNTLSIQSTTAPILSIVFTFGSGDSTNQISASNGKLTGDTWVGNSKSVTFTFGGSSGNRRISSVAVTYYNSLAFAKDFFDLIKCSGTDSVNFSQRSWNVTMKNNFDLLFASDKSLYQTATPNESGNEIEQVIARYCFILNKYGTSTYDNFMNRSIDVNERIEMTRIDAKETQSIVIVIIFLSVSISLFGIYFIIRRKYNS